MLPECAPGGNCEGGIGLYLSIRLLENEMERVCERNVPKALLPRDPGLESSLLCDHSSNTPSVVCVKSIFLSLFLVPRIPRES